jgi:FG-GAP-like repeat
LFGGDLRIAFVTGRDNLFLVDGTLNSLPGFPVRVEGASASGLLALADLDGDGSRDILVFAANKIYAFNRSGASLDNFPITLATSSLITSAPIVGDVDGDGNPEVVAVAEDGFVAAYDKRGHMAPGFPLQAGTGLQSAAMFVQNLPLNEFGINLVVASSATGSVMAWKTGSIQLPVMMPWSQYQKDARHSGVATELLQGTALSSEFFPKTRAYNWPNPVYDGKTFIRYYVKDNATVNIKIFDLAGDLVATIPNPPGVGGLDNEVAWDATGVQSGVYFARIEANGSGGNGVAVIKIAIVK